MSRLSLSTPLVWSSDGYTQPFNFVPGNGFGPGTGTLQNPYNLDGYVASASFTSTPFRLEHIDSYTVMISCLASDTINATVSLQGCNDTPRRRDQPDTNLKTWFPLYFFPGGSFTSVASQTLTASASPLTFIEQSASYQWVRMVFTVNSGSATLTAKISIKGI